MRSTSNPIHLFPPSPAGILFERKPGLADPGPSFSRLACAANKKEKIKIKIKLFLAGWGRITGLEDSHLLAVFACDHCAKGRVTYTWTYARRAASAFRWMARQGDSQPRLGCRRGPPGGRGSKLVGSGVCDRG